MKWYDYAYIVPIAIMIAVIATPLLWLTTVLQILGGAMEEAKREVPTTSKE